MATNSRDDDDVFSPGDGFSLRGVLYAFPPIFVAACLITSAFGTAVALAASRVEWNAALLPLAIFTALIFGAAFAFRSFLDWYFR